MNLIGQQLHMGVETDRVQPYAPYGKACLNCTKSKTRCAVATAGGKCERCHRLNKDCQPSPSVRKKSVFKRPATATSSKTAALEEKLDGLVQMLQRSQTSIPGAVTPPIHIQKERDHSSSDPTKKLQYIESLWICFTAVKSWFNTFFSLEVFPLSVYTHFSMVPLTQIAHCLVALFRLSTFDSPDIPWDRQRIRQEMDFGDIVQLIFDRWERVPEANGIEIGAGISEVTEDGYESEQS